ncbi:MAG: DNA recombination protein RmuC [Pyrinomonadaceae bacterium]
MTVLIAVISIISLVLHLTAGRDSKNAGKDIDESLRLGRTESMDAAKALREEVATGLKASNDTVFNTLDALGKSLGTQVEGMTKKISDLQESNQTKLDAIRKENSDGLKSSNELISTTLEGLKKEQKEQLDGLAQQLRDLAESNQSSLERIRNTFDERVKELQEGNEKKLEEMRKTVDEKLHDTLEKRLGESFKLVSEQLVTVHQGLGEMQTLATGVGDLKRVLTNVKARGTWAEVQLGNLLEQTLTANQYDKNVAVNPDSGERVEFAIKLPGPKDDPSISVWLPIDSKFPQEDYLKVQDAADSGDPILMQTAVDGLARAVRIAAKDISGKYVCPPHTTDFAIMFLATEGLHAEILRQPALVDELQRTHRVVIAGPTTLSAIMSSLRMGFQTLAVEKRASEVWQVLGAIKTEFGKFGTVLAKVKKQLNTASKTIDATGVRSRAMERHLKSVEEMPELEVTEILALGDPILDATEWASLTADADNDDNQELDEGDSA